MSFPPPQPGRTSRSSVRATQSRKIGASRERSATCSTRSTNTGSAHCRSSMTTTCGRSAARASSSRRNASCVSRAATCRSPSPGSTPIAISISTSGQYVIPSPYEQAAAAEDVGRVADALEEVGDEARLADPGRPEEREEPARAVGDGVLVVAPEPLPLALASDERASRGGGRARPRRRAPRAAGTPRPAPTSP